MYSSILLPTDGSEGAATAIEVGIELAGTFDAAVHALSVIDERLVTTEYNIPLEDAEREAEAALDHVGARGSEAGRSVEKHLRRGTPHDEILAAIDDYGVDLVVMGTHGRTGLSRVRHLGSVTERVIRDSPVQVHTVPISDGRAEET